MYKAKHSFGDNVKISWEYELDAPDFDYGNEEENQAEMERFDSGELVNAWISVKVYDSTRNVVGVASLGQVFLTVDGTIDEQVCDIVNDEGLLEEAEDNLKEKIKEAISAHSGVTL